MAFAAIYVPEFMVQAVVRAELRAELHAEVCAEVQAEAAVRPAALASAEIFRERPMVLMDGNSPLWNVVAANSVALQLGICLGMTKANAAQFAGVELRARSAAAEKAAHAALRDVGWSVSPRVEDSAADLLIVDVAGLSSLLGAEQHIAELLAARAAQCGLRVHVAIAETISAAEVAARGFAGITLIAAGEEAARIGTLPISVLSPAAEIAETLKLWGIHSCAELARLPVLQLSERLGQAGVRLRALARGAASRALVIAEAELAFEEEMELDDAVEELEPLSFVLGRLLEQLCARLAARALAASVLRVRFDLQPAFENALDVRTEVVRAKRLPGVYERTMQLPVPMRDPKLLLKLLRLRLQGSPPGAPIVKALLAAEAARPRMTQRGLLLPSAPDVEKLELTLARLESVVGEGHVGSAEVVDSHRPGEFRMEKFSPAREEEGGRRGGKNVSKKHCSEKAEKHLVNNSTAMSFRVFRPPLPINVNSRAGQPAEVFLQGRRGEVHKASGPWRTSGEWWREEQWSEDEWDLEVRFVGKSRPAQTQSPRATGALHTGRLSRQKNMLQNDANAENSGEECCRYRIYFDVVRRGWFARGMYD
jgi:protein ImuB